MGEYQPTDYQESNIFLASLEPELQHIAEEKLRNMSASEFLRFYEYTQAFNNIVSQEYWNRGRRNGLLKEIKEQPHDPN